MINSFSTIKRAQGWIGNGLIAIGITMIVLTVALYAYGEFERFNYEKETETRERIEAANATADRLQKIVATSTADGIANATAVASVAIEAARVSQSSQPVSGTPVAELRIENASRSTVAVSVSTPISGPTIVNSVPASLNPTPMPIPPTATPIPAVSARTPLEIKRIVASSIGLNSAVVNSRIVNGEWQVPKFSAGHLQGTGLPGEGRNVVLSGHVQSLTSGNVFSKIDQLNIGDDVTLRTVDGDVVYRISGKSIVPNDDLSVVQSSGREELTLITCTGSFNVFTRDYSHRWIVWGDRLS